MKDRFVVKGQRRRIRTCADGSCTGVQKGKRRCRRKKDEMDPLGVVLVSRQKTRGVSERHIKGSMDVERVHLF